MMRNLLGIALAGFLAVGIAGSAGAAMLSYTGTLTFGISTLPSAGGSGGGVSLAVTVGGHLSTLMIPSGALGPITMSLPVTSSPTIASVRVTGLANLTGTMSQISGGPPGGGAMGLSGLAKICLFDTSACQFANVPVPLTPTAATGMGIGGTQLITGGVALTMQHQPWTLGAPQNPGGGMFTVHTANSSTTTPALPAGFATPLSSTARNSGVLQLVTVSKVYTSLTSAFPEVPVFSILNLHVLGAVATPTPTPTPTPPKKVTLCHMGKKTISVGVNAVPAHLKHGDTLGECGGSPTEPPPTPTPEPTSTPTPGATLAPPPVPATPTSTPSPVPTPIPPPLPMP